MSISLSGTATASFAPAPHITAAALTAILATAPENTTVANFVKLQNSITRIPNGNRNLTLFSVLRATGSGPTLSGTKTVTKDVSPLHTAASLTTLLATAWESLTLKNMTAIASSLYRIPGAGDGGNTLGSLFI